MSFENPTFHSTRTAPPVLAGILTVCASASLSEVLGARLRAEGTLPVQSFAGNLAGYAAARATNARWSIVVFEASRNLDADLEALDGLAGVGRFLALTDGEPTESTRAAFAAVGVEEILPIAQILMDSTDVGPHAEMQDVTECSSETAIEIVAEAAPDIPAALPAEVLVARSDEENGICAPQTRTAAPGAVPDLSAEDRSGDDAALGQITAVMRSRGGAGATTVALNLAAAMATTKGNAPTVVLVDLDIQNGKLAVMLDLPESATFSALIRDMDVPDAEFLDRALERHASGLCLLPAPDALAPLSALTPQTVTRLLELLRRRFDHVIVDLPLAVVEWIAPVLAEATRVLIVTDTAVPSIKQARRLIDLVNEENMALPVRMIVNRESRPFIPTAAHREAAHLLGRPLDTWIPAHPRSARAAEDMGAPLVLNTRRAAPARALRALAADLLARPNRAAKRQET